MDGRSYRKLLDFRLPKDPVIVKAGERASRCTSRGHGSDTGSSLCAPFPQRNLSGRQQSARGFGDSMESILLGTGEEDRKKEGKAVERVALGSDVSLWTQGRYFPLEALRPHPSLHGSETAIARREDGAGHGARRDW